MSKFSRCVAASVLAVGFFAAANQAKADSSAFVYGNSSADQDPAYLDLTIQTPSSGVIDVHAPVAPSPFVNGFIKEYPPTAFAGYYTNSDVGSNPAQDNYVVGALTQPTLDGQLGDPGDQSAQINSFLVYNISGVQGLGTVVAASEHLYTAGVQTAYTSETGLVGGSDIVSLYDINTPLTTLPVVDSFQNPVGFIQGDGVFNDLQTGNFYGSYDYTAANAGSYADINLTPAFLSDLNAELAAPDSNHTVNGMLEFGIGHTLTSSPVPTPGPLMGGTVLLGGLLLGRQAMRRRAMAKVRA